MVIQSIDHVKAPVIHIQESERNEDFVTYHFL